MLGLLASILLEVIMWEKFLEQNRSRLLVRKRNMEKEQLLLKKNEKQREFYIAYSQLRNLIRTRDITEFVNHDNSGNFRNINIECGS